MLDLLRRSLDSLRHIVGGLGTAVLALGVLLWLSVVAVLCLVGVGFVLIPGALSLTRSVANRERGRLSRWGVSAMHLPGPVPERWSAAVRDPFAAREIWWLAGHASFGLVVGLLGLSMPLWGVQDVSFPLWYRVLPDGDGPGAVFWTVHGLSGLLGVSAYGVFWLVLALLAGPALAAVQAWPGRRLLTPPPGLDLSLRVAELTATRAAALDAHAAELRRIERSLHDGTQNRLVAVTVLLGAARRAMARDPDAGVEMLDKAQQAAEQALAELRTVVRGILPPVLDDRGLAGALDGLAGSCPVPCRLEIDLPGRCAASVEATAYFVVAEALTNVVKHSGATEVVVSVRREDDRLRLAVEDNGHGGASEGEGSGITGIRRRVEAYDGSFAVLSPVGGPTVIQVGLPCGT